MKSSSTGSPNLARISAMISACLTVSILTLPTQLIRQSPVDILCGLRPLDYDLRYPAGTDAAQVLSGAGNVRWCAGLSLTTTGAATTHAEATDCADMLAVLSPYSPQCYFHRRHMQRSSSHTQPKIRGARLWRIPLNFGLSILSRNRIF